MDESTERLDNIQSQCDRLGLSFERISAINGKQLSSQQKAAVYDTKTNQRRYYKQLNDGEIGCYMSHIACWKRIVELELDYALILEDDAELSKQINDFIQLAGRTHQSWDYIALSYGRKTKSILNARELRGGIFLGQCLKLPSTTTGQFVSLSGAGKLIKHALPIARPVDMDIQYWYEKSLRCFVVRPFPVTHGDFGSAINEIADRRSVEKNRLKRIWQKVCFEVKVRLNKNRLPQFPPRL